MAVGRYDRLTDRESAEVALAVEDHWQGHGLGTLLLDELASSARRHGVTRFVADVLTENRDMLDVFHHSGYGMTSVVDGPVVHVTLELTPRPLGFPMRPAAGL